jgi:hypothetical protein
LTISTADRLDGDHRFRPHINALQVRKDMVQLGLFGCNRGDFRSSQLLEIPWREGAAGVLLGETRTCPVRGFHYPHNVQTRPGGSVLGCCSARGEVVVGDRRVFVGGFTRGIALSGHEMFVGVSTNPLADSSRPEPAGIVCIDRRTLQITGRFSLGRPGQIFDVRLANASDYGMSAHAEHDPLAAFVRSSAAA